MRIVHVETGRHFYGGARQVVWLLRGLVAENVDCRLVCPPGSAVGEVAAASGLNVEPIECTGDHDLRFAWRLRALIRSLSPDLVHCHSRRGADILGGIAARTAGVPAILTRRVDNPEPRWASRLRYRCYDRIVAISQNVRRSLLDAGVDDTRIELIPSAVDSDALAHTPDRALLRSEFDIDEDDFAIAVVAQFIPRKGHRFLLDVLPGIALAYPHVRVVLFGEGRDRARLGALARKLGVASFVRFAGYRPDLGKFLGAFDVLVHPAEREGLGVAMLEAAAAGLPIVAFDVAGAKEVVKHGETGILVEPGDLHALQSAIVLMIEAADMRHDFAATGRHYVRDAFSIRTMVEKHLALYRRVLDERKKGD